MRRSIFGACLGLALMTTGADAQTETTRDPNFGRGERVSGESFAFLSGTSMSAPPKALLPVGLPLGSLPKSSAPVSGVC